MDDTYKKQIEDVFNKWEDGMHLRFRHKALRDNLREIRDDYRHDVGGDEKSLTIFEREVQNVAREHNIDYQTSTNFWELNAPRFDNPINYIETEATMRFPDGCEIDICYTRQQGNLAQDDSYKPSRIPDICDYQLAELTSKRFRTPAIAENRSHVQVTPERVIESLALNRARSPILQGNANNLSYDDYLGWASAFYSFCYVEDDVSPIVVKECLDAQAKETYGKEFVSIADLGIPDDLWDLANDDYYKVIEAVHAKDVQERAKQALSAAGLDLPDYLVDEMVEKSLPEIDL